MPSGMGRRTCFRCIFKVDYDFPGVVIRADLGKPGSPVFLGQTEARRAKKSYFRSQASFYPRDGMSRPLT